MVRSSGRVLDFEVARAAYNVEPHAIVVAFTRLEMDRRHGAVCESRRQDVLVRTSVPKRSAGLHQ